MKLRQKLAMVLAATMIVTAVPVVTMAASTATITTNKLVAKEGLLDAAVQLKLEIKDTPTAQQRFYIKLDNAEFASTITTGDIAVAANTAFGHADIQIVNGDTVQVTFPTGTAAGTAVLTFANNSIKLVGGEASFVIDGGVSTVTDATVPFAVTSDSKLAVITTTKLPSIYDNGTISDITIKEPFAGVLEGEIVVQLDGGEFEITNKGTITGAKGLSGQTAGISYRLEGKDTLVINVPASISAGRVEAGELVISGVKVEAKRGVTPTLGKITASVYGDNIDTTEIEVAEVVDYGMSVSMKDNKVVNITGGQAKNVTFTIKETENQVLRGTDRLYVELSEGFFVKATTPDVLATCITELNAVITKPANVTITDVTLNSSNQIIGFEFEVANTSVTAKDEITFTANVKMPLAAENEAEGTLTVEGKSFDTVSTTAVTATQPVEVTAEPIVLKSGLQGQVGGKVVITETAKGMIGTDVITLTLPTQQGVLFAKAPVVEVEGNLNVKKVELTNNGKTVKLTVDRKSKEAATITIKDFVVDTDRSLPEGKWDLTVAGGAIETNGTSVKAKGFFQLGTLNTEDLAGSKKVVTTIAAGAKEMIVNGEVVELPAVTYIKNGKMMAPLKAVAQAFGINASDIIWNNADKSVTVVANGRTAYLQIGNKAASLNGVPYTLATPAEIVNDSTFVPVGDLGRLLGLSVGFDNETKTATFNN